MRRVSVIAIVVIVVAVLGIVYRLYIHPKPAEKPVPNPLLAYESLAHSPALDTERQKLAADYEKKVNEYFVQGAAREKALREEMANASAEQKKAFEAEIAGLRKQLEDFAAALRKWRSDAGSVVDHSQATSTQAQTAPSVPLPAPPAPPIPPESPEPRGSQKSDADQKAFQQTLALIGAAVCLAQPELAPFVGPVIAMLAGLGTADGGRELAEVVEKTQRGEPVDPATLQKAEEFVANHPEIAGPLATLGGHLQQKGRDELGKLIDDFVQHVGVTPELRKVIASGGSCESVKSFFNACADQPCFASAEQKEAVHVVIEQVGAEADNRYWKECLATVAVRNG